MQTAAIRKTQSDDFRLLLQREFVDRCKSNPRYSLRAFAKSLGIEPSPLSAILRGSRPLTSKMKQRLGFALGLGLDQIAKLQDPKKVDYQQISFDNYAIISDWYHYAILELIKVEGFKGDIGYIAKTLSISKTEAHIAVERLQRVGLLEIVGDEWIDLSQDGFATNITGELTSEASRKLQRQVLEMSIRALTEIDVPERNHTSMTMAINPEDLPEARKRIQKFRRELCAFLERNSKPTHVYQLGVSLYPISKVETENEN